MFDSPKAPEYGLMDTPVRTLEPDSIMAGLERQSGPGWNLVCSRVDGDTRFVLVHHDGTTAPFTQRLVKHSPTGMEWGYGGSGPADLALNILALFVDPREASRLHQDFKWATVSGWQRDHVEIPLSAVRQWIADHWANEQADVDRMTREEEMKRDAQAIREADAGDSRAVLEGGPAGRGTYESQGDEPVILSDDFSSPDDDLGIPDESRESYAAGDHTHGRADAAE